MLAMGWIGPPGCYSGAFTASMSAFAVATSLLVGGELKCAVLSDIAPADFASLAFVATFAFGGDRSSMIGTVAELICFTSVEVAGGIVDF